MYIVEVFTRSGWKETYRSEDPGDADGIAFVDSLLYDEDARIVNSDNGRVVAYIDRNAGGEIGPKWCEYGF